MQRSRISPPTFSPPNVSRFTLIEMVVVITIAVIIMSLTVGTYMKIGPGMKLNNSAHAVAVLLSRARQTAMAKRRLVALLMPGPNVSGIPNEKRFAAFRLAYVTEDNSSSPAKYVFDSFVEDTEWHFCEEGISIMEADGDCGIRDGSGPLLSPSEENGKTVDDVDLTGLGGANSVDNVRAVIFAPNNRLKASCHQYITLGQANYNSGTWQIENTGTIRNSAGAITNISCVNQVTIEVNRYTGGTRYYYPEKYP
ncbi:MAG: hypothetical protein D6820_06040 [Lentisphaerae bacterium]|nr:MAG: hypothetical protein D6820_06040 [Lentisphaerota bacterium]